MPRRSTTTMPLHLALPLFLLLLLPGGAHALFSWPGGKNKDGHQKQDDINQEHASAFHSLTGGTQGMCLRTVKAAALSSHAYPANDPIEDRHLLVDEQGLEDPRERIPGMLHAAVLDGHGGFEVAERVHTSLVPRVKETLLGLPPHLLFDERVVTNALVKVFVEVEQEWMGHVAALPDPQTRLQKSTVGACGLYVLLMHSTLFVANAGDCRAVLARRKRPQTFKTESSEDGETDTEEGGGKEVYEALPLSFDHNSREEREQALLMAAHPGEEEDIVLCVHEGRACYVKGRLQPVRAFGDLHLKLEEYGPPADSGKKWTPPYVSAIPEVVSTRLNRLDSFMVLASDGLWDVFNNGEVVAMVAKMRHEGLSPQETAAALTEAVLARVAEEMNVSVEAVKSLTPGRERRNRHDDITVVVVFFEEERRGVCPSPGTPEYDMELEEDEEDLRIVDSDSEWEGEEEYDEAWDDEEAEAWLELEEWDEEWGEDGEEDEGEWEEEEEDVDLDFMDEL